ncbi:MAG TPA: MEDS domain-containing protein [Planctomycetota bacterium]|nr:MEDS domain-containing protein [Planctomycetota bacterium]
MTVAPFSSAEAAAELIRFKPALGGMIQERRIRILDAGQWYRGRLPREAVDQWLKEEEQALAAGYRGLRVSGNTSFVTRPEWDSFMAYEEALNDVIGTHRIVVLCSYDLRQSKTTDQTELKGAHPTLYEV